MGPASRRQWIYRSAVVLLGAFCLFEAIKHGWVAALTIVVFILLPDVVLVAGFASGEPATRRREVAYRVAHSYWPPLVLIGMSLLGWPDLWLRTGLEFFLAGLAWATHVTAVRAFDLHVRTRPETRPRSRPKTKHGRQRVDTDAV